MASKALLPRVDIHKAKFLAAFSQHGTITHAAREVGINPKRHYEWLLSDPEYITRFKEAREQAVESLEREARRRAIEGTEQPVYWQGEQIGTIRKFSDVLLIFLLKGAKPEVYRERYEHRISGNDGGPIEIRTSNIDAFESMCEELASRFNQPIVEVKRAIVQALEGKQQQAVSNTSSSEVIDVQAVEVEAEVEVEVQNNECRTDICNMPWEP